MIVGQPVWYWALFAVAVALIGSAFYLAYRRELRRHRQFMARLDERFARIAEDGAWRYLRKQEVSLVHALRRERFAPLVLRQELAKLAARDIQEIRPGVFMAADVPALHAVEDGAA